MAPRIIDTDSQGERKTLLREFVSGTILSDLYLNDSDFREKAKATGILIQLLTELWELTLKEERPPVDYVDQIRARLGEVYAMHPYLEYMANQENLDTLLDKADELEPLLAPRFSVWLHGDFNINNVFYQDGQMQFIDVHRSHYGDYLSDIGVFLGSTLRQPHLQDGIQRDMEKVRNMVMGAATSFGQAKEDEGFPARLKLSLARSHITSSRIVVDKRQARALFQRGVSLLKEVVIP
jgi:Ser/Thr protein kinase RdoA (MazF antagonist)